MALFASLRSRLGGHSVYERIQTAEDPDIELKQGDKKRSWGVVDPPSPPPPDRQDLLFNDV